MGVGASTRVNVRARWRAIPSHMDGCLSVSQKTVLSIQGLPGDSDFKTSLLELKAQASPFSKSADFLPLAHTQGQKAPVDVVVGVSCWSTLVMSSCCPASASARVARLPNGPADSPEPDETRQAGFGDGGGGGGGVADRLRAARTCMEELKVPAAPLPLPAGPSPQSLPSPHGVWTSYLLRRGQGPFCSCGVRTPWVAASSLLFSTKLRSAAPGAECTSSRIFAYKARCRARIHPHRCRPSESPSDSPLVAPGAGRPAAAQGLLPLAKAGDFFGVITAAVSDRRLIVGLDGLRPGSLAAVFGAVFGSAGVREALLAGAAAVPLVSGTLRGLVEVRIVGDPPDRLMEYFCCFSSVATASPTRLSGKLQGLVESRRRWRAGGGRGAGSRSRRSAQRSGKLPASEDRDRTRRALATRTLVRGRSGLRKTAPALTFRDDSPLKPAVKLFENYPSCAGVCGFGRFSASAPAHGPPIPLQVDWSTSVGFRAGLGLLFDAKVRRIRLLIGCERNERNEGQRSRFAP